MRTDRLRSTGRATTELFEEYQQLLEKEISPSDTDLYNIMERLLKYFE